MKKLTFFIPVLTVILTAGCALNPLGSGGKNGTITTEAGGASITFVINGASKGIEIIPHKVTEALIGLTDTSSNSINTNWKAGDPTTIVYDRIETGNYTLRVEEKDDSGASYTNTAPLTIENGYNYTINLTLGGHVNIEINSTNTNKPPVVYPKYILEVNYTSPGPDGIWFTADDVASEYRIYFNDNLDNILYSTGPDHIPFTADDAIEGCWTNIGGFGGLWIDGSGHINNSSRWDTKPERTFSNQGPDGIWMTGDDLQSGYYKDTYDAYGDVTERIRYSGKGADYTWQTADDVPGQDWYGISWKADYDGDKQGIYWAWTHFTSYDSVGPDGIPDTADDHMRDFRKHEFSDGTKFYTREYIYTNAGPDGLMFTADDRLAGYTAAAKYDSYPAVLYIVSNVNITINGSTVQDLNPLFFGFNYWLWPDEWGYNINHTEELSRAMKIRFFRAGGINNDAELPQALSDVFQTRFGEYCKTNNAEALLQVPIISHTNTKDRIDYATNLIRSYMNKGYALNYVSIGNEPDGDSVLYQHPDVTNALYMTNFTVNDYIDTFTNMSVAIKKAFPGIKIVGLELGWKYDEWIAPFVSACRSYMDILSIHRYGYWPITAATYTAAKGEFDNLTQFYSSIRAMTDPLAPGLPLIIGEMNASADCDPSQPYADAMPGTFNAALWLADNIGVTSRQANFVSLMPWSICEDWRSGFIVTGTLQPKPSYYSYLLFSNYAKKHLIHIQKVNADLRVYAYKDDSGNVSVFCVNWSKNTYQNLRITFNGVLGNAVLTNRLEPWSLTCLDLSSDMTVKKAYIYTSGMADSGSPYQTKDL